MGKLWFQFKMYVKAIKKQYTWTSIEKYHHFRFRKENVIEMMNEKRTIISVAWSDANFLPLQRLWMFHFSLLSFC